jgi:hypothetical protein
MGIIMTRFWRNSLEVVTAIGTIILGTPVVHGIIAWWSTPGAFH